MSAVTLHASPSQRRCGIAVRAKGDLQLTAVILPKPWRSSAAVSSNSALAIAWTGSRLCLTLYEGDRVRIDFAPDDARAADRREVAEGLVSPAAAPADPPSEQDIPLFAFSAPISAVETISPRESVDVDAIGRAIPRARDADSSAEWRPVVISSDRDPHRGQRPLQPRGPG